MSRLSHVLLTGYKSEIPTTLSLESMNLLEQLTELRETFYLLYYRFIINGYNAGTARWERGIGQDMGKGMELPGSCQAAILPASMCSPTQTLSEPHPFGFLWQLHYIGMID